MANPVKERLERVKGWEKENLPPKTKTKQPEQVKPPADGEPAPTNEPKKHVPNAADGAHVNEANERRIERAKAERAGRKKLRNLVEGLRQPDLEEPDYEEPTKGHDLVEAAKPGHKLANARAPAWNRGFRKEMTPAGKQLKTVFTDDGHKIKVWANAPGEGDERALNDQREQAADRAKMNRGVKELGLKGKVRLTPDIKQLIVDGKAAWDGFEGKDDGGAMEEFAEDMDSLLRDMGQNELADRIPDDPNDREAMDKFLKLAHQVGGIPWKTPIPDLVNGTIIRADGVEQTVWHMPIPEKQQKLKLRPGFVKETRERPHGGEGRENDTVTQTFWAKDEDYYPKGVINQGEWKFDPNQKIVGVQRTEGTTGSEWGGVNPSAIVTYEDGSKAFIKKDKKESLMREYGASKFFHSTLADKMGFTTPKSNVVPLEAIKNEDLYNELYEDEGEVIRNEFINGYPLDIILDEESISKINVEGLIDAAVFSYLIGNNDMHGGNVLIDDNGTPILIDTANSLQRMHDPTNNDTTPEFSLFYALNEYVGHLTSARGKEQGEEDIYNWIDEKRDLFENSVKKLIDIGLDKLTFNLLQSAGIENEKFDEYAEIIKENFDFMKIHYFGTANEKEDFQKWWESVQEERIENEADHVNDAWEKELYPDGVPEGEPEKEEDPQEALMERIRQRNIDTDALREQIRREIEAEYDLVPKDREEVPVIDEAKLEIPEIEYTMNDLLEENIRRRQIGLPTVDSIAELKEIRAIEAEMEAELDTEEQEEEVEQSLIKEPSELEEAPEEEQVEDRVDMPAWERQAQERLLRDDPSAREEQREAARRRLQQKLSELNPHKLQLWSRNELTPSEEIPLNYDFNTSEDNKGLFENAFADSDKIRELIAKGHDAPELIRQFSARIGEEKATELVTALKDYEDKLIKSEHFNKKEFGDRDYNHWQGERGTEPVWGFMDKVDKGEIIGSYDPEFNYDNYGHKWTFDEKYRMQAGDFAGNCYRGGYFHSGNAHPSEREILDEMWDMNERVHKAMRFFREQPTNHNKAQLAVCLNRLRSFHPAGQMLDRETVTPMFEDAKNWEDDITDLYDYDLNPAEEEVCDSIANSRVENCKVMHGDEVVYRSLGDTGSVQRDWRGVQLSYDATVIHNHPEDEECLSSFSEADVLSACGNNERKIIVTTGPYRFVMERPEGGWNAEFFDQELQPRFTRAAFFYRDRMHQDGVTNLESRYNFLAVQHLAWKAACKSLNIPYKCMRK